MMVLKDLTKIGNEIKCHYYSDKDDIGYIRYNIKDDKVIEYRFTREDKKHEIPYDFECAKKAIKYYFKNSNEDVLKPIVLNYIYY